MSDITASYFSPSGAQDLGSQANRVGNIWSACPSVSQGTSVSTAVTLNGTSGKIVMFAGTIAAANGLATFTLNNTAIGTGSTVEVAITDFAGTYSTNGLPMVLGAKTVAAGSVSITVINIHASNATGANSVTLAFTVTG